MRLRLAILGASVAFAAGLSATAASAVGYRPRAAYAVAPIMSWTGFYIGGHVGVAWSDVEWSNVAFSNVTLPANASTTVRAGSSAAARSATISRSGISCWVWRPPLAAPT